MKLCRHFGCMLEYPHLATKSVSLGARAALLLSIAPTTGREHR